MLEGPMAFGGRTSTEKNTCDQAFDNTANLPATFQHMRMETQNIWHKMNSNISFYHGTESGYNTSEPETMANDRERS